jgi:hypothetical protein
MRRWLVLVIVLAALASVAAFTVDARQEVTGDLRLMAVASYVAFGLGGDGGFVSEADLGKASGVTQEDKDALVRIRTQFEKWHRYVSTNFPDRADLLVVVRTGRRGRVGGQAPVGGRPAGSGARGVSMGGASSPDDMLLVYTNAPAAGGRRTQALVWQRALPDGLAGASAPLFEQLRAAIEAASK